MNSSELRSNFAATPINTGIKHDLDELSLRRWGLDTSVENLTISYEELTTYHKENSAGKQALKRECESYHSLLHRCMELLRSQDRERKADEDIIEQHREEICHLRRNEEDLRTRLEQSTKQAAGAKRERACPKCKDAARLMIDPPRNFIENVKHRLHKVKIEVNGRSES